LQNIFKQHSKGLYLLFFVEMWERFSFYGMRALIVLYMIQELLFSTEKAGNIYGLYTGVVYLTPLIGGYLADRYWGQRRCITAGATFMCIGLFLLSSSYKEFFLIALFLMIIANGFFKSNISSLLGILYENNPSQKDSAFTIFYMGINLGAFFSPLVCGTLAIKYGFQAGFLAAGIGMLIGLILYKSLENGFLGQNGLQANYKQTKTQTAEQNITNEQKQKLFTLFTLMIFSIAFWVCYEQAGSSLTLFAEYSTNRNIGDFLIPTGYFQSLNPLYIILLAPLISSLWNNLRNKSKEPTSVEKFAIALSLMFVSYIVMALAGYFSEGSLVSPLWLICVYFIMTIAELCISPIGLSLVSKLAPKQFLSLIMGTWFLTSFFGNTLAGFWGGKYGSISNLVLFATLAGVSFVAAVCLWSLVPKLNQNIKD